MTTLGRYNLAMPLQVNSPAMECVPFTANTSVPVNSVGGGYNRFCINKLHIFGNAILGAPMHREWRSAFLSRSGVCVA